MKRKKKKIKNKFPRGETRDERQLYFVLLSLSLSLSLSLCLSHALLSLSLSLQRATRDVSFFFLLFSFFFSSFFFFSLFPQKRSDQSFRFLHYRKGHFIFLFSLLLISYAFPSRKSVKTSESPIISFP